MTLVWHHFPAKCHRLHKSHPKTNTSLSLRNKSSSSGPTSNPKVRSIQGVYWTPSFLNLDHNVKNMVVRVAHITLVIPHKFCTNRVALCLGYKNVSSTMFSNGILLTPPLLPSALKSNSCCLSCKRIDKSICFCCNYFIRLFQRNGWGDDLFLIPISYLGACHMTDRKNKLGSPIGRNKPLITTQHEV